MSALTKRYLPTLKKINRLAEKQKHQMIKNCDRQLVDCFSECAKNILKRHVPLNPSQFEKLRRNKTHLRTLAKKRTSLRVKRKILQRGGFLASLLPPILSVLGGLLLNNATR